MPVVPTGEPAEIGFPLVVKAAAGGGGRGMRVVREPEELDEALEAAAREAEAAFGDGTVFCERYVERPRHVEIQLLGDTHGTVMALGERDCSVQRRHQKVLEESPSPAVDPELRAEMSEAAVAFAKAIGYTSAGTAEFMLDGRDFFFLELNGRIQVEHPVTELVTGRDLIRDQIRIAEGERLSVTGTQSPEGHAVEVRLYAEDPRSFLPQAGTLERLRLPTGIRVDAGVAEGDEIGIGYDPMIAKLIAHGPTRAEALARLADALAETEVGGVTTNLPFLRWLVAHPVLLAGEATTAFLTEYPPLSEPPLRLPDAAWRGGWRLNLAPVPPAAPPDVDSAAHDHVAGGGESRVTAPMPGTVIQVNVAPGDHVEARRPLLVLEAMKMETPLTAPYDSTVKAVHVARGRPRRRRRSPRRARSRLVGSRRGRRSTSSNVGFTVIAKTPRGRRARCGGSGDFVLLKHKRFVRLAERLDRAVGTTPNKLVFEKHKLETSGDADTRDAGSRTLEELLQLHRRAHVALDLELPGHVGGGRVLLAVDDRHHRLLGGRDRRVGLAAAVGHLDLAVLDLDEPLAGTLDVEQVRVVHPGRLLGIGAGRQAVEELLHVLSHLGSLLDRWNRESTR